MMKNFNSKLKKEFEKPSLIIHNFSIPGPAKLPQKLLIRPAAWKNRPI